MRTLLRILTLASSANLTAYGAPQAPPTTSADSPIPVATPAPIPSAPVPEPASTPAPVNQQPTSAPAPVSSPPLTTAPVTPQYYVIVPPTEATPQVESTRETTPKPVDPATIHHHDGFYLRLSVGVGYVWNHVEGKNTTEKFTVRGSILPLEVLVGGTLIPGFALGGGLWLNPGLQFRYDADGVTKDLQSDYSLMFAQFGPFIDYYPDPNQGLHFLGAVTLSNFSLKKKDSLDGTANNFTADGFGFTVGIGQEFWIGKQWSAGFMGKFTYAGLSRKDADLSYNHRILSPSLVATFTLN